MNGMARERISLALSCTVGESIVRRYWETCLRSIPVAHTGDGTTESKAHTDLLEPNLPNPATW